VINSGRLTAGRRFKMWDLSSTTCPFFYLRFCYALHFVQLLAVLTLIRVGPTPAIEPPVALHLESGTICRRTSGSRTCHTAVSDSRQITFLFDQCDHTAQYEPV